MKKKIALFLLAPLVCAYSCSSTISRLSSIDGFVNQCPDSALAILQSIQEEQLHSRKEKALYALQLTKAMDKSYLLIDQDSLISDAMNYFPGRRDSHRSAETFYFQGRIQYNRGSFTQAIISFTKAAELAEKSSDNVLKGLIALSQAYTYDAVFNEVEQLKYAQKSYSYFAQTGDQTRTDAASLVIAMAYHSMRNWERADAMYDSLRRTSPADSMVMRICLPAQATLNLVRTDSNPKKSIELFKRAVEEYGAELSEDDYAMLAYAFFCVGEKNLSHQIFEQLEEQNVEFMVTGEQLSKIAEKQGDYKQALALYKRVLAGQDSIVTNAVRQMLPVAQRDYFSVVAEQERDRANNRRLQLIIYVLCSLFVAFVGIWCVIRWRRRLNAEMDNLFALREETKRMLQDAETRLSTETKKRKRYISMYKQQYEEIGKICETLVIKRGSKRLAGNIIRQIRNQLSIIVGTEGDPFSFEKKLDAQLGGVMRTLRSEFPLFSSRDYQILSYYIAGFDATFISIILNVSPESIRVKKHRLLKVIRESDSPARETLLELIP